MEILIRIAAAVVGVLLIYSVMKTLKQKKMSVGQSMLWLLAGLVIILGSAFPQLLRLVALLTGKEDNPSVPIFFLAIAILGFISFSHAKELSVMRAQMTELTEQVSVLKYELTEKQVLQRGRRTD